MLAFIMKSSKSSQWTFLVLFVLRNQTDIIPFLELPTISPEIKDRALYEINRMLYIGMYKIMVFCFVHCDFFMVMSCPLGRNIYVHCCVS